jgi:tRNA C32,U32 (ribose-2'-O)-methylase TrmJ
MNLGQAVAVCLYQLARRRPVSRVAAKAAQKKDAHISTAASERITLLLFEALQKSGYIKRGADSLMEERLRRMVRRLHIPVADSEQWQGMLRHIVWKISQASPQPAR